MIVLVLMNSQRSGEPLLDTHWAGTLECEESDDADDNQQDKKDNPAPEPV